MLYEPGDTIKHVYFPNDSIVSLLSAMPERSTLEEFRLTQDFMSNMLGVRREGVNKAAGALQTAKLIHYSRGMITILDRRRLEAKSCECYAITKAESDEYLN